MAVPGALTNYSVSTTDNTVASTNKEGGTLLGNDNTGDVITKAFELITATKDNYNAIGTGPITGNGVNAMVGAQKALAAGTFAYHVAGEYVIARASATLSGVSKTQLLTMGAGDQRPSIAQFYRQIGAKVLTAFRSNRFSWTSTMSKDTVGGDPLLARHNWVKKTTAGGDGVDTSILDTLTGQQLRAIGGATRNGVAADADYTDAAANGYVGAADVDSGNGLALADTGLRKVPGRLVMKSNFVNLNPWTSVKTSARPDFNNYKPITG
jgi:hypothetical protein